MFKVIFLAKLVELVRGELRSIVNFVWYSPSMTGRTGPRLEVTLAILPPETSEAL